MAPRITKIVIEGLWGRKDDLILDLNNTEVLRVIHGDNGCGKTSVLTLIDSVFNLRSTITEINFNKISFDFDEKQHLSVYPRKVEKGETSYYFQLTTFGEDLRDLRNGLGTIRENNLVLDPDDIEVRDFINSVPVQYVALDRDYQLELLDESLEILNERFLNQVSLITERFHQLQIDSERNFVRDYLIYKHSIADKPLDNRTFALAVKDLERIRVRAHRAALIQDPLSTEIVAKSKLFYSLTTIIKTDVENLIDSQLVKNMYESMEEDWEAVDFFSAIFPSLDEEIDPFTVQQAIDPKYADGLFKEEDLSDAVIHFHFQQQVKLYLTLEPLLSTIELFSEMVNDRFRYVEIFVSCKKGIRAKNKLKTNNKINSQEESSIPLKKLSSGERHLLVLMFEICFPERDCTLFLIDEPETSLNPRWQESLLGELESLSAVNANRYLLTTHSPSLVLDRVELLLDLSENRA